MTLDKRKEERVKRTKKIIEQIKDEQTLDNQDLANQNSEKQTLKGKSLTLKINN